MDDVVERTPVRLDDRRKRATGRIAERDEAHAEAILGETQDPSGERLIIERRVGASDAEIGRCEHHAQRRLTHVERTWKTLPFG